MEQIGWDEGQWYAGGRSGEIFREALDLCICRRAYRDWNGLLTFNNWMSHSLRNSIYTELQWARRCDAVKSIENIACWILQWGRSATLGDGEPGTQWIRRKGISITYRQTKCNLNKSQEFCDDYSFFSLDLGDSSSTILFGSFHARATYLVWLPRANISPLLLLKLIDVKANVLPTLSLLVRRVWWSPEI